MEVPKPVILCIDDDDDTRELIKFTFRLADYQVTTCSTAEEGLLQAEKGGFGAIILDNRFGDSSGERICREIRRLDQSVPIVFFSGETRPKEIDKALAAGANAYLVKPNDFEKLTETVISLIEKEKKGGESLSPLPTATQLN
jgi:DNA-binding response OmpR family regulator